VTPEDLRGFFSTWPTTPSPETHHRLLAGSTHFVVARVSGRNWSASFSTNSMASIWSTWCATQTYNLSIRLSACTPRAAWSAGTTAHKVAFPRAPS